MPVASEEQVPKALTYTLMYHFLWCVMFALSALTLTGVFLASGHGLGRALLRPLPLVFLALVAGAGAFATYVIRVEVLLGEVDKARAFRWSAISSWAVLAFAPALWLVWSFGIERLVAGGLQSWSVPAQMTAMVLKVEVIVWWLSHLLSVRGLSRGRKRVLGSAGAPAASAVISPDAPATAPASRAPAIAGEGVQP